MVRIADSVAGCTPAARAAMSRVPPRRIASIATFAVPVVSFDGLAMCPPCISTKSAAMLAATVNDVIAAGVEAFGAAEFPR